jgi:D-alanyl-D-alanine carboxypeptidase
MTAYLVFGALRDKKLTLEQTLPVSSAPGTSARAAAR